MRARNKEYFDETRNLRKRPLAPSDAVLLHSEAFLGNSAKTFPAMTACMIAQPVRGIVIKECWFRDRECFRI